MTAKKKVPTPEAALARLREDLQAAHNNEALLVETLAVLEQQIYEQGWISLFGGQGKELSKDAMNTLYDMSRVYWLKNPLIKRAVDVQALYVFAQGVTVKAETPQVDEVVRRFMLDHKNAPVLSHQALMALEDDLRLAGNLFFAFFVNDTTGRVIVRTFPLYEIQDIITDPDDRQTPWFYKRDYWVNTLDVPSGAINPTTKSVYYPDWRHNPKERPEKIGGIPILWETPIMHVKTNCLPDWKFGVPELYSAIDWAQAYKKFLENWSKLVDAYARFAFSLTTKGGSRAVAAGKARLEAAFAKPNPNLEMADTSAAQRPVASTFTATEGVKLEAIRTQGATTSADDARRLMLMVCSASGIPEQIEACDPSTGNLATATAMERPLELQFLNRQTTWQGILSAILDYVIDWAIRAEALDGNAVDDPYMDDTHYELADVPAQDGQPARPASRAVAVKFPPLLEHDTLAAVQAIVAGATLDGKALAGTMDLQTVAAQVLKTLNIENPDKVLAGLFPAGGEPVTQTDAAKVQMLTALLGASGVDPWAIATPEEIRSAVSFLQGMQGEPDAGTDGGTAPPGTEQK